jgi:N-formylmaleamate deformylase
VLAAEDAVLAAYNGFHLDDIFKDIPFLPYGTLLMVATRGEVIQESDVDELLRLNDKIQVVRMHHARHMIPWDDLEGFVEAIDRFISGHPPRA